MIQRHTTLRAGFAARRSDGCGETKFLRFFQPVFGLTHRSESPGEADFPEIWPEPLAIVVQRLALANNYLEVAENLPDIELLPVMGR